MANKKGGKQFWKMPKEQTVAPPPEHPYWRKNCDLCEGKGIYRVGKKVVCRAHKEALRGELDKQAVYWESKYGQFDSKGAKHV